MLVLPQLNVAERGMMEQLPTGEAVHTYLCRASRPWRLLDFCWHGNPLGIPPLFDRHAVWARDVLLGSIVDCDTSGLRYEDKFSREDTVLRPLPGRHHGGGQSFFQSRKPVAVI